MPFNNDYTDEYNLSGTTPSNLLPNALSSATMPIGNRNTLFAQANNPLASNISDNVGVTPSTPTEPKPLPSTPLATQKPSFKDFFKNLGVDKKQALNMALLSAGFNMMSNAGRSYDRPVSTFGLLGEAGQQGMNTYQSALTNARQEQTNALHNALLQGQIEAIPLQQAHLEATTKALENKPAGDLTPTGLAVKAASGDPIAIKAMELSRVGNTSGLSLFPLFSKFYPDIAERINSGKFSEEDRYVAQKFLQDNAPSVARGVDAEGNIIYTPTKYTDMIAPVTQTTTGDSQKNKVIGDIQPFVKTPVPASNVVANADLNTMAREARYLVNTFNPDYTGWWDANISKYKQKTIGIPTEETNFRQTLDNMRNYIMKLRSGAVITDSEALRLEHELPGINEADKTVKDKLANFAKITEDLLNSRTQALGAAGYRRPSVVPGQTEAQQRKPLSAFEGK